VGQRGTRRPVIEEMFVLLRQDDGSAIGPPQEQKPYRRV
jgi:hypothetical protein